MSDSNQPNEKLALGRREAAKAIGIGERLLWTWTNMGKIPHKKIGARTVYPIAALEQWLNERGGEG